MYKVFFNESFLIIGNDEELHETESSYVLLNENIKPLELWLLEAELSKEPVDKIFICINPEKIWELFTAKLKIIPAAGGL